MRRLLWLLLLLTAAGMNGLMAQIASFSFSGRSTSVSGWTNLPGDPHSGAQIAMMNGVTISSIGSGNWSPNNFPTNVYDGGGAANGVYFPAAVMSNTWLQYNGTNYNLALYNALLPQLRLSGLNPDSTYILRMSGSDIYYQGSTQYTVAGLSVAGSQYLNTYNNTTQGVTFRGVQPDSNGTIRVYVNATSTAALAFISGLQVYPESANIGAPVVALTAPTNGTVQSEGSNLSITATATEPGGSIAKVEFYADTTKIGEADAAPYSMTWVDPDPGSYQLTAKATDATGTISTVSVNIGVQSLNYFWSTTGNIATKADSNFLGTVDSNRLSFRTNNLERMSITGQGTVMVGIATPDSGNCKLKVNGTTWTAGLILPTSANAGYVLTSDASGNATWQPGAGGRWLFSNGTLYDTTDNIAIGTSNPQGYKLAVNGSGIFTKIVAMPHANWPDYVFDKSYRLPSLADVEQYIQLHHHLPGVTPEAEILRNGIDLGEGQTALLKKVEELTLYLINEDRSLTTENKQLMEQSKTLVEQARQLADQNRQLKEQHARMEAQQKEIDELKVLIRGNHKQ